MNAHRAIAGFGQQLLTELGLQNHSGPLSSQLSRSHRPIVRTLTLTLLLHAAVAAAQSPVVEPLAVPLPTGTIVEGTLDWTAGTVTVTGEGFVDDSITHPVRRRLLGFRAAKVDAYRKLLEAVGGVRVDARTTVSMAMVASDTTRAEVEGLVVGALVVPGSRVEEDGYYKLGLRLELRGALSEAILPDTIRGEETVSPDLPERDSVVVFVPAKPHTGLVVDARGTSLRPSLSPRILDDSGHVIYAASHVSRTYAVETGVVAYTSDIQEAVANERVGGENSHAFLVRAVDVSGLYNSDVIVTRDMGTRIRMADMEADFLAECRVVFVVGPKPPAPVTPATVFSEGDSADSPQSALSTRAPAGDFLDSILEARAEYDSLPVIDADNQPDGTVDR